MQHLINNIKSNIKKLNTWMEREESKPTPSKSQLTAYERCLAWQRRELKNLTNWINRGR